MRKPGPKSLLVVCFLVLQSLIPLHSPAQGARVRPGTQAAGNKLAESDSSEGETQDADADDPRGREEWFRSGRHAAGERASDLLHRAYVQKRQMTLSSQGMTQQSIQSVSNPGQSTASGFAFSGSTYLPNVAWSNLGPAPIGSDSSQDYGKVVGRVTSVAVDQGDISGNTVYIGAAFGGVWKSRNAAAADPTTVQWKPLIDDQPSLAVGAVTVQPGTTGNNAVVIVGTGEPNSSGDSYYGMGILRSTDGGQTWAPIIRTADAGAKTFAGLGTSKFAWSTANPNLVVVGMGSTNGKRYGSDSVGGRGIYYSQDAGQTWHYATVQDPGAVTLTEGTVTDVAYNPGTGRFYAFYRYHGFYESADGITWSRSAFQPQSAASPNLTVTNCPTSQPNPNPTGNCPLYRGHISIQPTTLEMYVIYVNDNDIHQGLFVTSNGATTVWREITSKSTAGLVDTSSSNQIVQGDYNLWMAAIATSQGTDLLIGTRNIYKCSLTGTPADCSTTWKNLTHVYDCNPIAQPSHVHPDQHGFDFNLTSPHQMYFVNDGGVYRSLNGANGDGSCNAQQVFDNLDANIGSLSEMVSFSQHPTNPNVLLGGLQDNGTPALLGSGAQLWQTVNGGDGGFNEIDPNNPDGIWYATNTGVSIQQCDATNKQAAPNGPGIPNAEACNPGAFGAAPYPAQGPNIGTQQVANDPAEFYMPFILDPANTANLILGTCRLWRGPGVGGNSWLDSTGAANKDVSPMFDSTKTTCISGTTKVRAIAAGGPAPNGISQVLYVGLEGTGTVSASGGLLGHVFVNTQADVNTGTHGAANGWTDITSNIAAVLTTSGVTYGPYPISSIEVDHHDTTGKTAYVTVEGFGVPHIFKTTTAGSSWSDITNNLPDAPVDSIAVDPDDPNVLYVGSDIGAFISLNAGSSWEILGIGLPNVPVTKIRVFGSNTVQPKLLRVSTYGRGVWQFALPLPPAVDLSPNPVAFGNRLVKTTSAEIVTVTNNSGSAITIASVALGTPGGTDFAVSNNGCPTTPATLANLAACQIQVSFTPQSTTSESNTIVITDSAAGSPRAIPLSGTGIVSALSLSTSALTFTGSVQNATSAQIVTVNNTATSNATITGLSITAPFTQSGGTCSAGASLGVNGSCTIQIIFMATSAGQANGTLTLTDLNGVAQIVNLIGTASDFAIAVGTGGRSQTVNASQSATYNFNASAVDGFNGTVTFACTSGLPTAANCTFSPSTSVAVSTTTAVTLTISTMARSSSQPTPISGFLSSPPRGGNKPAKLMIVLGLLTTLVLALRGTKGRTRNLAIVSVVGGIMLLPGCGGGAWTSIPPPVTGTPAGTYAVTVTATSGNRSIPTTLTLKVN